MPIFILFSLLAGPLLPGVSLFVGGVYAGILVTGFPAGFLAGSPCFDEIWLFGNPGKLV